MADAKPSGVRSYDGTGKTGNTEGSHHPENIGPGRDAGPGKQSGGGNSAKAPSASNSWPSLSRQSDGRENLKAKQQTMQATTGPKKPPKRDNRPSGLHRAGDGISTPRKIKK